MADNDPISKLYHWRTDFSSSDTNVPLNEEVISDHLGSYARDIKANVKRDLSLFDSANNLSVGKEYALYKSDTDANIASGNKYDLKLRNFTKTDLGNSSFTVEGNYSATFYPGTRFLVADSDTSFARDLSLIHI